MVFQLLPNLFSLTFFIDLTYTGKSSGQKIFQFNANTIYAIEHDYLVKTCPQNTQTLFYDRLETAERAETLLSSRYTIVYTTGKITVVSDFYVQEIFHFILFMRCTTL